MRIASGCLAIGLALSLSAPAWCEENATARVPSVPPIGNHGTSTADAKADAQGSVREIPIDMELGRAMGVFLRRFAVQYPEDTKLSIFTRVYNSGVLDKAKSSVRVHARRVATLNEYIGLGVLDPDVLTGLETRRMKVFDAIGPYWITVPPELSKGWSMRAIPPERLSVGKDYPFFDLVVGLSPSGSSGGFNPDEGREQAAMRVTIDVRLDPLSPGEEEQLRKHQNYGAAFKLEQ